MIATRLAYRPSGLERSEGKLLREEKSLRMVATDKKQIWSLMKRNSSYSVVLNALGSHIILKNPEHFKSTLFRSCWSGFPLGIVILLSCMYTYFMYSEWTLWQPVGGWERSVFLADFLWPEIDKNRLCFHPCLSKFSHGTGQRGGCRKYYYFL